MKSINAVTYTIKQDDNLTKVAKDHDMSLNQLLSIQGNEKFQTNPNLIHPGDKVYLSPQAQEALQIYTVKAGDNLTKVAKDHNMNLNQLLSIKGNEKFSANPNLIHPGDKVYLQ